MLTGLDALAPFHEWTLPDGSIWAHLFRIGDDYAVRFPGLADFRVSADGARVDLHPHPGLGEATGQHLWLNQVRPLALGLQGAMVFHGAAVEIAGRASAFLAASGRGKSTLAAGFATRGNPFLTDDCLVIEPTPGGYAVEPSHPSVRLCDDSRAALLSPDAPAAAPVSYSSKGRFPASTDLAFRDRPCPLRAVYVLGEGAAAVPVIEPVRGGETVAAWVSHSFLLDINDRGLLARHFDRIAALARIVPCFRLDYPRRYEGFGDLHRTVLAHAEELDERGET